MPLGAAHAASSEDKMRSEGGKRRDENLYSIASLGVSLG